MGSGRQHYSPTSGAMMRCVAQPGQCKLSDETVGQLRDLGIEGYDAETLHNMAPGEVEKLTERIMLAETGAKSLVGAGVSRGSVAPEPGLPPRQDPGNAFDRDSEWNESTSDFEARQALERRSIAASPSMKKFIPREGQYEKYYAETDKKHFSDKTSAGSKFTDPTINSLEDVAALALQQRGSVKGDDRDKLIAMGANPDAFGDKFRYLMVKTEGKLGAAPLYTFPPGTRFRAVRTKEGGSVSLVADVDEQPSVDYGVVVVGRPPGVDQDVVVTAHPGLPSRSSGKDTFGPYEGRVLTAAQVHEIAGTTHVNVNTKVREVNPVAQAYKDLGQAERDLRQVDIDLKRATPRNQRELLERQRELRRARSEAEARVSRLDPRPLSEDEDAYPFG